MKKVCITCRKCKGTGEEEITGHLGDTYRLLAQQRDETTSAKLARECPGVSGTNMANRLAVLEKLGLAKSRRYGRERFFKAVKP